MEVQLSIEYIAILGFITIAWSYLSDGRSKITTKFDAAVGQVIFLVTVFFVLYFYENVVSLDIEWR